MARVREMRGAADRRRGAINIKTVNPKRLRYGGHMTVVVYGRDDDKDSLAAVALSRGGAIELRNKLNQLIDNW